MLFSFFVRIIHNECTQNKDIHPSIHSFIYSVDDEAQGFVNVRQVLYHWAQPSILKVIFKQLLRMRNIFADKGANINQI